MNEPVFVYVEDDPMSREVMELILVGELEFQYLTIFEDSSDFIERVEALDPQPTIFLLDIHVRPYTGFQMLEMLREHPVYASAIVVALTASVMSDEVQRLKSAGFDGIIAKPIDQDSFPRLLERIASGEKLWRVIE